jgi:hypothetical protein
VTFLCFWGNIGFRAELRRESDLGLGVLAVLKDLGGVQRGWVEEGGLLVFP